MKNDTRPLQAKQTSLFGKEAGPQFISSNTGLALREETPDDIVAITCVTVAAFMHLKVSSQTEHYILHALRKAGALTLSLVAEMDGQVVGHVAFSPVTISDGTEAWFGLGPISVLPGHQRQGIGGALIREGVKRLKAMGAKGCVLVGDPGYYKKHRFRNPPDLIVEGVPPDVFMTMPLADTVPRGTVTFHEGFLATE